MVDECNARQSWPSGCLCDLWAVGCGLWLGYANVELEVRNAASRVP